MTKKKLIVALLAVSTALLAWYYVTHPLTPHIHVHGHDFRIEVAVTPEQKQKGLGFRDSLCADCGMLFPYDHAEVFPFWMKGMKFPLDFIWIRNKVVVDITRDVPVSTNGAYPIYHPKEPVDQILEVNAGVADTVGIQPGDDVKITF